MILQDGLGSSLKQETGVPLATAEHAVRQKTKRKVSPEICKDDAKTKGNKEQQW
jgi:hypothetical protein